MKHISVMVVAFIMSFVCVAYSEGMIPGVEDGVLTVAMECAYAPYN